MPFPVNVVGETIESGTTRIVAQCCRLHEPPEFGSFVRVGGVPAAESDPFAGPALPEGATYCLVAEVRTACVDPGRRLAAFGLTEDELARQQPQIYQLLATDFTGLAVAHVVDGALRVALPPRPPRVHAPVEDCSEAEVRALTGTVDCAAAVLRSACEVADDLVAAVVRLGARYRPQEPDYPVAMLRGVARLMPADFARIDAIARKLGL